MQIPRSTGQELDFSKPLMPGSLAHVPELPFVIHGRYGLIKGELR
jgi:hypothetical protein